MNKQIIISSLQWVAIGDAFGVGIEFKSRPWIKDHIDFTQFVNVWKDGQNHISPGTYSDDTEHTIWLIEALLDERQFSEELLLEKFKAEYDHDKLINWYPRDWHGSIEKWYKWEHTIEQVRQSQASREDPGNAPVMRAVPLAFVNKENVYDYSIINARSTHPHLMWEKASLLTVLTARHFLRNQWTKEDLIWCLLHEGEWEFGILLRAIDQLPPPDKLSEKDYLVLHGEQPLPHIKRDNTIYGMPCAAMKTALNVVYVMKHATSAFDALKMSIRMWGDVDSLAAVCTGIAAGRYGLDSLPQFMLEQTEWLDRLEDLWNRLYDNFNKE
jgi:ADP-ribosylglycohydrolase